MTSTLHLTRRHRAALAAVAIRLLRDLPQLTVRQVAIEVGVTEGTVKYYWRQRNPGVMLRGSGRNVTARMRERQIEPFAEFCDVMHDALIGEMTSGELFAATIAQWGEVSNRRLYRAIQRLMATKRVVRSGDVNVMPVYRRSER